MNRIAPNNQLPATHFIEVWRGMRTKNIHIDGIQDIEFFKSHIEQTECFGYTIAIFRIRQNKLNTKHKF